MSPVSRDLRSTDCRLSKTCSVLLNIRVNDDNALFSLEKWTLETWAQHLARVDDNVVYTIFKYMNVDNRIGAGAISASAGVRVITMVGRRSATSWRSYGYVDIDEIQIKNVSKSGIPRRDAPRADRGDSRKCSRIRTMWA